MIILTLTNTGETNPDDYVSVNFHIDEDSPWPEIVERLVYQGLPALGYTLPQTDDKLLETLQKVFR